MSFFTKKTVPTVASVYTAYTAELTSIKEYHENVVSTLNSEIASAKATAEEKILRLREELADLCKTKEGIRKVSEVELDKAITTIEGWDKVFSNGTKDA